MSFVEQKIVIPVAGIIWLSCLAIAVISHFTKLDFGIIGILAWIVTILGIAYLVLKFVFSLLSWLFGYK